ncbi:EEF1A lysine methyltransferase 3-like isoform X2 [Narcine bancroftii]|uniref:EEF1A lysine methyltransferase 3-like isoform X2 n=1 Tax=Narcine bancroftii TaxID=1343680 RepID=UPI003831F094
MDFAVPSWRRRKKASQEVPLLGFENYPGPRKSTVFCKKQIPESKNDSKGHSDIGSAAISIRQARIGETSNDSDQEKTSGQDDQQRTTKNQGSLRVIFGKMTRYQHQGNTSIPYPMIDWPLLKHLRTEKQFKFCGHSLNIGQHYDINLGFSASIWKAALVLCQYFEQEKINFSGRKVIELGSGTGIVGILAVLLGGEVTMTDQENVLSQIEYNVSINIPSHSRHRSKVCALAWGKDHMKFPTNYDFILGSDIVYTSLTYPLLLKTLLHLSQGPTIIYLSSKLRKGNHSANFHEKLLPRYYSCQLVHQVEDKSINVYKMSTLNTTANGNVAELMQGNSKVKTLEPLELE